MDHRLEGNNVPIYLMWILIDFYFFLFSGRFILIWRIRRTPRPVCVAFLLCFFLERKSRGGKFSFSSVLHSAKQLFSTNSRRNSSPPPPAQRKFFSHFVKNQSHFYKLRWWWEMTVDTFNKVAIFLTCIFFSIFSCKVWSKI